MGVASYTEDDLERWLENIRLLKDDLCNVDSELKKGHALQTEERIRAVSRVAHQLGQRLEELEAAATHPWVSAAHRSLVEQSRAESLHDQLENLKQQLEVAQDSHRQEMIKLLERNIALGKRVDELEGQLKSARRDVRAEHDASVRYVRGVKPLKEH